MLQEMKGNTRRVDLMAPHLGDHTSFDDSKDSKRVSYIIVLVIHHIHHHHIYITVFAIITSHGVLCIMIWWYMGDRKKMRMMTKSDD